MALAPKEAIDIARRHFLEFFPDAVHNLRLEEIERDGNNWAITFSSTGSAYSIGPFGPDRYGKVILVDGVTGEFISIKQRAA